MVSLFPIRLVILGLPCSFKNSKRLIRVGRLTKIGPSKKSEAWIESATFQLCAQWRYKPIPKTARINAAIVSYLPSRQLTDADNLYGGPGDALQAAGILENDSCIESHDGSRRRIDKARPRVEITLTLLEADDDLELEPDPAKAEVEF